MPLLPRLSSLWRNLFHKARKERELAEEIDAYLEKLSGPFSAGNRKGGPKKFNGTVSRSDTALRLEE
jgi:hypothetical protein